MQLSDKIVTATYFMQETFHGNYSNGNDNSNTQNGRARTTLIMNNTGMKKKKLLAKDEMAAEQIEYSQKNNGKK